METIQRKSISSSSIRWFVAFVGHLTATLLLFAVFQAAFISESTFNLLKVAVGDSQLAGHVMLEVGIMLGLSGCLWAFMYLAYSWIRIGMNTRKKLSVVKTRGTILTETLIVFPVFLLLTFGLAQMSINSMAGLLATLATYESARTVAVWGPEVGHNRSGRGTVSNNHVEEKARVAAAAIMAPIAPNLPTEFASCSASNKTMDEMLRSLVGAGVAPFGAPKPVDSFIDALDTQRFGARGWYKLQIAYCRSDVSWSGQIVTDPGARGRNQFTTSLSYRHRTAFPFMKLVFGQFSTIERSYTLTQQMSPNPERPQMNVIRSLINAATPNSRVRGEL